MSLSLALSLTSTATLNTGGGDDIPAGSIQLLTDTNDLDGPAWASSSMLPIGSYTGPQGLEDAWELICDGGNDPFILQTPTPPVSLADRTIRLRVWAMSGDLEGYLPGFRWFSYRTLSGGGIDQVQDAPQAITASWARYEIDATFASWAGGDKPTWRVDPYNMSGGTDAPVSGASIYIAKPELWLLPA